MQRRGACAGHPAPCRAGVLCVFQSAVWCARARALTMPGNTGRGGRAVAAGCAGCYACRATAHPMPLSFAPPPPLAHCAPSGGHTLSHARVRAVAAWGGRRQRSGGGGLAGASLSQVPRNVTGTPPSPPPAPVTLPAPAARQRAGAPEDPPHQHHRWLPPRPQGGREVHQGGLPPFPPPPPPFLVSSLGHTASRCVPYTLCSLAWHSAPPRTFSFAVIRCAPYPLHNRALRVPSVASCVPAVFVRACMCVRVCAGPPVRAHRQDGARVPG